jgi:hypothetical protein
MRKFMRAADVFGRKTRLDDFMQDAAFLSSLNR